MMMSVRSKNILLFAMFGVFVLLSLPVWGADIQATLRRWTHISEYSDREGIQNVRIKVTYYSNEYVEALVLSEAEKNLWTKDETENYKYTLLKSLNLNDSIAFHFDFNVTGVPMYAQPFDRHLTLMIGGKRYQPSDYDKRFNFKMLGERDGMVFFSRYDPKSGEDILERAKDVRLSMNGAVSQAMTAKGDALWVWDISKDDPKALGTGTAMDRLELDRLIRRMEKLNQDRQELQTRLDEIDKELGEIRSRSDQLQTR